MRKIMIISLTFILAVGVTGCSSESSESTVVKDGTYEGTITEINAEETEIYVEVPNKRTLELYFKDQTKLLKNEKEVPFKTLQNGQKVEVKVERVGKRLDPLTVRILE